MDKVNNDPNQVVDSKTSIVSAVKILMRRIRYILLGSLLLGLLVAGYTLLLPNFYQATTSFYAASPDLARPTPIGTEEKIKEVYGNDHDIDRLLSIAESNILMDKLIEKFNLMEHYGISPESKNANIKVKKRLAKFYNVQKTKLSIIKLTVEDEDPLMAKNMADYARMAISEQAQSLVKLSQKEQLENLTSSLKVLRNQQVTTTDSIKVMKSRYNIIQVGSQSETMSQDYTETRFRLSEASARLKAMERTSFPSDSIRRMRTIISGLKSRLASINQVTELFNNGSSGVAALEEQALKINKQISTIRERINLLGTAYNTPFLSLHIIDTAILPEEKSRPRRSLIVLGAMVLAAIFLSIFFLLRESLAAIDWS